MVSKRFRRGVAGLVAGGAALLAVAATTQSAAAALPEKPAAAVASPEAYFYTGTGLSGDQLTIDLTDFNCHTMDEAALSAVNISEVTISVYYNSDCRTGWPGSDNDTYYVLGSLHSANFPRPALSYQVVPIK